MSDIEEAPEITESEAQVTRPEFEDVPQIETAADVSAAEVSEQDRGWLWVK